MTGLAVNLYAHTHYWRVCMSSLLASYVHLSETLCMCAGPLYLLSCLAELHDTRSHMLQAGLLSALVQLVNRTHDERVHASATSLLRLLTHSKDRQSTDSLQ